MTKSPPPSDDNQRIAKLVRLLQETELELQVLTGGQLDAITLPSGDPLLLREAQEKLHVAEAAQRITAETQIAILNALPAHIALLDAQGVILTVNESWRRFASANMPQSADFFVGQNYLAVCEQSSGDCAEEAQDVANGIRRVLSGETPMFSLEYPCHSLTEQRWFRLMVTPLSLGTMTGAVVMHVNVTERRLAEEDLRKNQQRLELEARRLHESQAVAHVGSWETDLTTQAVTWTEETHRIFGTNPAAFSPTHESFLSFVHLDDRARVEAAFAESHGRPEAFSIEHSICLADGTIKHVEERWQAFNDDAGRPTRAVGTCYDITERIRARETRREAEERNSAIVASALDAIISIDHENRILEFNPSAEAIFGWPKAAVLGRDLSEVIIPEHLREAHRHGMARYLQTGEKRALDRRLELPAIRADGTEIVIELNATRLGQSTPPKFTAFLRDLTQQKRAEQALAETQERYRNLVEASHDLIYSISPEGQILFINEASRSVLGYAPDELIGRNGLELIPADRREQDRTAFAKIIEGDHGEGDYLTHVLHKEGNIVLLKSKSQFHLDKEGALRWITGNARDVTQSIRAEEALRASESRLRAIFENEPECVKIVSLDGILLDMNPAGLRMIEASDGKKVIGKPVLGLIHPEDHTTFMDLHTRATRGETAQAQFRITGLKGTELWMDSHSTPLRAADGTITSVLSVTRDSTQSKKAADILRTSESRFRALFEQAAVGMCLVSSGGEFLRINRRFCEIVGYSAEVLLTRTCIETTHPDDRAREAEITTRMLAGELQSDSWEKRYLHQNGRVIWCNLTLALIPGQAGDAQQFVGVIEDITERRLAAEERDRMFNLSVDLLSVGNFEGGLEQVNPAWTRCLGWSAEELTNRPWMDFVHPDDHEATRATGMALLRGERIQEFENRYRCRDGTYRWLSWNSHPLPETRQIFGVCRDVTEQRQRQEQLRLLETCVSRLNDIVLITDAEPIEAPGPRIVYVNDAFVRRTGYTLEEVLGKSPRLLQGPKTQRDALDRIRTALTQWKPVREELINYTKSGEEFWLELDIVPVADSKGWFTHWVSIERDITKRRQADEMLRQNQTMLRIAGSAAKLGGWSIELPNYRLTWSDETARIHDLEPGHTPSLEEALEFYLPEYREKVAAYLDALVTDGTPFDFEHELITAKQRRIWVRAIGEAVRDAQGRIAGMHGAFQDITEQKAAEEKARSSAERLAQTLESITDSFFTLDREWCFTYVNAEAERVLNSHRSTLLERSIWEAFPTAVGSMFDREYRRALKTNATVTFEEYYPPLEIWFEVKAHPTPEGLAVYFRDVTERRRTNDALRASESKFRQLAESNILGILFWNAQGDITDANDAFLRMVGYTREDLASGQIDWRNMTPPEYLAQDEKALAEIAATGSCMPFEKEYFHKDGHRVAILIGAAALDGAKDQGICYVVDISPQKQAEAKVRASEASLVQAQSIAQIGNWDWNIETNELYWSAQVFELFGIVPGEFGCNYEAFLQGVHPEDRERVHQAVQDAVAGTAPYNMDHRVLRPDGSVRVMHEQGVVTCDSRGRALKMTGTVQDVHDLKMAQLEINRTNRALQLLSRCNEALIRSETESGLLAAICQIAVDIGGFRLAWVGYARENADRTIECQSHAGVEEGYLSNLRITWAKNDPAGQGPAGQAIRHGEPVVIPDLDSDESFKPWRESARVRGFRGVIALPLADKNRTFGVLVLYLPEVRQPLPDEMLVLQELADDMAFGIGTLRSKSERHRMELAVRKMAASVSASNNVDFFFQLAANMAEALAAQAAFVTRILPEQPLTARTIAAIVDGQQVENFDYAVSGTPCEGLLGNEDCIVPSRVADLFPQSPSLKKLGAEAYVGRRLLNAANETIGFLFALYRSPLEHSEFVSSTLQIFATRANAELERRKSDARLREQASLLDKARDAILVRNLDHTILYWNQSAERLYGWTAAEAIGRSAIDLFYHNTKDYLIPVESTLTTGEWQGELQQCTKAGALVAVEARWTLVRDDQGEPQSILAINTDITERKKLEQQFLRAQRMESIGTLAGGIAHDLNNVLAPIMMSIELLKIQEKDPRRLSVLNTIETSSKRGADMVKQVLSFARGVESQQLEVQAGHLLTEIEKLANETFLKNIQVRSTISPDLWIVRGDPTQLHQVLLNLCVNARDAMPYGGTISLAASNLVLDEHYAGMNIEAKPGPHVRIVVEDTGTGMPPEVIERIFEPFFTTKELGKGTGLGLSTTIAIIKSHGGFLRVYSEVGVGTRFHVYLPAQTEPGAANMDHLEVELPGGQGQLILVIDDEASIRQITQQTLEAFGYRVVLASDGAEAAAIYGLRRHEIAAVLTDMMMPVMDGPATIQVLMRMNPQVRIIAASGLNANGMVAKAVNVGVKHFIPKPYTAETLLKTLHTLLNETNATR